MLLQKQKSSHISSWSKSISKFLNPMRFLNFFEKRHIHCIISPTCKINYLSVVQDWWKNNIHHQIYISQCWTIILLGIYQKFREKKKQGRISKNFSTNSAKTLIMEKKAVIFHRRPPLRLPKIPLALRKWLLHEKGRGKWT